MCSATDWIRFLRPDGSVLHEQRHRALFSSWNTIYRSLLELLDPGCYLLGREVTGLSQPGDSSWSRWRTVKRRSRPAGVRRRREFAGPGAFAAGRQAVLLGYVAWRGTLPEQALPEASRRRLGDLLTYQVRKDSHILVYPIPGLSGALTAGDRLVNFVWYVNVAEGEELRS